MICKLSYFPSSFPVCTSLITFSFLLALVKTFQVLYWIGVERMDNLVLCLILVELLNFPPIKLILVMGLSIYCLYYVVIFLVYLISSRLMKGVKYCQRPFLWLTIKRWSHVVYAFSVCLYDGLHWFLCIELSLHLQDKAFLIMVDDLFPCS